MAETSKNRSSETRPRKRGIEGKASETAAKRAVPPGPSGDAPPRTKKTVSSAKPETPQRVPAEERWKMIAEAAYYIAEKRGFAGGHPAQDWAEAEAAIDVQFAGSKT
jgi:hypothetical protein